MSVEELADRLSAIAEELGDMAFDHLRLASESARVRGEPEPGLVESERRLARARRSVEKAIAVLREPVEAD